MNTGMKKYITARVPLAQIVADNLPLRLIVTIPAIGPSDPSDDTEESAVMYHTITITEIRAIDTSNRPKVISVQRLDDRNQTVSSAFLAEKIPSEPFDVRIVLSEKRKGIPDATKTADELAKDLVDIDGNEGVASNLVIGTPFARFAQGNEGDANNDPGVDDTLIPHPSEGMYEHAGDGALTGVPPGVAGSGNVPAATGPDAMYYEYRVTITPHKRNADFTLKVKVKEWEPEYAQGRTFPNEKYRRFDLDAKPNGREQLTLTVMATRPDVRAGYRVTLPKDIVIPAGGYLVITKNNAGSAVIVPPGDRTKPMAHYNNRARKPAEKLYNVYEAATLPSLATLFLGGVVVDLEVGLTLKITEAMWGENVSLLDRTGSQYIELHNPGTADVKTPDDDVKTFDKDERLTLVFYRSNEFSDIPAADADGDLPAGVADRIGTLDATGAYWSPSSIGQSGSSGVPLQDAADLEVTIARTPITAITSMYRVMDADGEVADGQMAASWMSSEGPKNANFDPTAIGIRHGTPGAATDATDTPADTAAEEKAKADALAAAHKKDDSTGTIPQEGQVYISEIMFAGGGSLPQWIEIANGSKTEHVNLSGWTLTIANAAADADVSIGAAAKFTIPDGTTMASNGQQNYPSTILVVTEAGRTSLTGQKARDHMIVLNQPGSTTEVDLILAGVTKRKYTLLSDIAFSITLSPPEPAATKAPAGETTAAKAKRMAAESKAKAERKAASDTVGNLSADGSAAWALPMSEDGRSSIIRRHIQVSVGPAEPEDGTMAENWTLAADTAFAQPTHIRASSYYGAMSDVGTPRLPCGRCVARRTFTLPSGARSSDRHRCDHVVNRI